LTAGDGCPVIVAVAITAADAFWMRRCFCNISIQWFWWPHWATRVHTRYFLQWLQKSEWHQILYILFTTRQGLNCVHWNQKPLCLCIIFSGHAEKLLGKVPCIVMPLNLLCLACRALSIESFGPYNKQPSINVCQALTTSNELHIPHKIKLAMLYLLTSEVVVAKHRCLHPQRQFSIIWCAVRYIWFRAEWVSHAQQHNHVSGFNDARHLDLTVETLYKIRVCRSPSTA
jgi:hypothetical protein